MPIYRSSPEFSPLQDNPLQEYRHPHAQSPPQHPEHRCSPFSLCGEFICDRCRRIRPWCRGVGTDFEEICDECHYALQRAQGEIE